MVDFPQQQGKMCDWDVVEVVDGANTALATLSKRYPIYIATNAADSSEQDIRLAFERVGLDTYISGYFCRANLGVGKDSPEYFEKIIQSLNTEPGSIVMIGDTLDNDVLPALKLGLQAIWFNPNLLDNELASCQIKQINQLSQFHR